MRQRGVVVGKENGRLLVKMQGLSEACGSCKGCMRWTPPPSAEEHVLPIDASQNEYLLGDEVIVEMETKHLLKAIAVLYGLPFLFLFLGYAVTRWVLGSDPVAGLGGIGGLLLGALLARPWARRFAQKEQSLKIVARACS